MEGSAEAMTLRPLGSSGPVTSPGSLKGIQAAVQSITVRTKMQDTDSRKRFARFSTCPPSLPKSPAEAELERVPNPHPDTVYVARFTCPEFTCLCPVTGQPDFAHFVVDYAPRAWLVESKSLKLYLASFRNIGAFHEDVTVGIGKRMVELVDPAWLRIGGYWYPRGGIPIDVFWQHGTAPDGVWIPDQGVKPYRGRG